MNKALVTSILISLLLILILIYLLLKWYLIYGFNNKALELIIQIYGTFIATLLGVYISLYYSRKRDRERDEKQNQKIMLGYLKVIWSELDINEDVLKFLYEGLKTMPRIVTKLYDQISFLIEHCKGLKNKAFYGSISSGAISEISTDNDIFNNIQQAYYNTELAQNGLNLTTQAYKDLANPQFVKNLPEQEKLAFEILNKEIEKVSRTIELVEKAKKTIFNYLKKEGVTFSKQETEKQKKITS